MAARGKVLEPLNLVEIQQTLNSLHRLHSGLKRWAKEAPLLWGIGSGIIELKELERENSRLKKLVPDISLDNSMLKEAARGNS